MRQRLLDGNHDTGDLRQLLPQLVEHLFAAAARLRIETHDDLGCVDALRVLIEFGTTRSTAVVFDTANLPDLFVDHGRDAIGRLE